MSAQLIAERRLKYAVQGCFNGVWGDEPNGVDDLTVVRVADFDREKGRVSLSESPTIRAIPLSARNRRVLAPGDLLIEKSGGGEQQPVGNVVLFDATVKAVCSNFVARLPVSDDCDSRYVGYVFRSLYTQGKNVPHIKQTSGIQNLDSETYLNERAWLPGRPDQEQIANFLDEKTARIDALIAEKETLLTSLSTARESFAFHLVTEGLFADAPRAKRPEEWFSSVPAHWTTPKLGYFAEVGNGSTPRREVEAYWLDGTVPWITSTAVNDRLIWETGELITELAAKESHLRTVRPRSTIVGLIGQGPTRGMAAQLMIPATLSQNVAYVSVTRADVLDEYLVVAISGLYSVLRYLSDGSGGAQGAMNCDTLRNFRIAVPPVAEQTEIVAAFRAREFSFSDLQAHVLEHIARLREYRSSLISAAVTGQLDISNPEMAVA